jgi:hypothetical protein
MEGPEDSEAEDEAIRQREEKEIEDDYNANLGESQGRDIEHLVLITHGIGQLLGLRFAPQPLAVRNVHSDNRAGWKASTSSMT